MDYLTFENSDKTLLSKIAKNWTTFRRHQGDVINSKKK